MASQSGRQKTEPLRLRTQWPFLCVCVCVCVRACVRACVRVCAWVCVLQTVCGVRMRACLRARACVRDSV